MLKKIVLLAVITLTFFYGCNSNNEDFVSTLKQRGEIVVAMDVDIPGYFVLNGESYGYQYDMLKAYADHLGVGIRIVSESSPEACAELIRDGEVDVVATLSSHVDAKQKPRSVEVYNTSYVILAPKGSRSSSFSPGKDFSLDRALSGSKLLVSSGFKTSQNYNMLVDSMKSSQLHVSSRNSFDLIRDLNEEGYDYLICEKSEAQLGCALENDISQVYEFSEKISMSVVLNSQLNGLQDDFTAWLDSYRNGEEYALLNELYFEKGIVGQLIAQQPSKVVTHGISPYDAIIKEVSAKQGHDWRFISAIAYSESRFNAKVVSLKGARGLMQIMPVVARQFNVEQHEVMKPDVNILLATKLLTKIERTLKLPKDIAYKDRMSIILACYNGGIGHVIDARNLARKYGDNPNSWSDVSLYLRRKADPAYNMDEVVKCGRFTGSGQTLAFVNKVMVKYNSYCNNVKL